MDSIENKVHLTTLKALQLRTDGVGLLILFATTLQNLFARFPTFCSNMFVIYDHVIPFLTNYHVLLFIWLVTIDVCEKGLDLKVFL